MTDQNYLDNPADTPGRRAADAILDKHPDGGAGNPDLLDVAAKAAQDLGDHRYATALRSCAVGWRRYLKQLEQQIKGRTL